MIRINLVPEVKRKAPKRKAKVARQIPYTWIVVSLIAVILAGVASLVMHLKMVERLEERQQQAAVIQKEIEKFKIQQSLVEKARKQRNALAQKLEIIATLKRRQTGPVRLLDELAATVPTKLWLQEMAEGGGRINLTGYAVDHTQVANFMQNLKKSQLFNNVELLSATAGRAEATGVKTAFPVKSFEINCGVATVVRAK